MIREASIILGCALVLSAPPASAQTYVLEDEAGEIVFRSDDDIVVVRGLQRRSGAYYELLFADKDGSIQCVATREDGAPIAAEHANMSYGYVAFDELKVNDVAQVSCRWRH